MLNQKKEYADPLTDEQRAKIVATAKRFITEEIGNLGYQEQCAPAGKPGYRADCINNDPDHRIDCSHLVQRIYQMSGLDYKYLPTAAFASSANSKFEEIANPPKSLPAKVGDVIVFLKSENGSKIPADHMGVITVVDSEGEPMMFVSATSGKGKGALEAFGSNGFSRSPRQFSITEFYKANTASIDYQIFRIRSTQ